MNRLRVVGSIAAAAAASLLIMSPTGPAHAATASSGAASKVVVACPGHQPAVKPGRVTLACDSDYVYLTWLHWSSWTTSQARAAGALAQDNCVPSCLAGHFITYPVRVLLSGTMNVPGHRGEHGYATLSVTFTGARPAGLPKTIVYKLPLPR